MERIESVSPKRTVTVFIVLFILLLGLYIFLTYKFIKNTYAAALDGKSHLEKALTLIESENLADGKKEVDLANKDFSNGRLMIRATYLWRPLPWVGTQIKTVNNVMGAGVNLTGALSDSLGLGLDIFKQYLDKKDISFSSLTRQQKGDILGKISGSQKQLEKIKVEIDDASTLMNGIPETGVYQPIATQIQPIKDNLPKLKSLADSLIPLTQILPKLTGYPDEVTYLFLLENNDELRPTGGFIGNYGILKIHDADITEFKTDNIYNIDDPAKSYLQLPSPAPLVKYLKADNWYMRDSNWSPDFITSAQKAEWFYHQEQGPEQNINGVIAMTPAYMASLLKVIGNQQVEDILFTPENLADRLEERVGKEYYALGIPEAQRKEIIGKMALQVKDQIFKLPLNQLSQILTTTLDSLNQKQILIYSKSSDVQSILQQRNWAGEVKPYSGDYLEVVDANLASLKTDQVMSRDVNYSLTPDGNDLVAHVVINYHNNGVFTWKTSRYRTYTRIYVPKGSTLIKATGLMDNDRTTVPGKVDISEDLGKTVFGGFISIEPGQTGTLTFEYKLPSNLAEKAESAGYNLLVQKQPGTYSNGLNVNLQFPAKIKEYTPTGLNTGRENPNTVTFRTDLQVDREFSAKF